MVISRHLRELAQVIGPRGSATPSEARAASYAAAELEKWGYKVEKQSFFALTTFSWLYITFYLWPLVGWALGWWWFSAIGTVFFFLELNTVETVSKLFPKGKSTNVIATHPQGNGQQVVLVAHLDSSKAGLNFSPQMVKNFRLSFLVMVGSMVAAPLLQLMGALFGSAWHYLALLPSLYLVTVCGTLLHREYWNYYTHGANDNASGVAAVLAVAESYQNNPPPGLALSVLLTGCEESGTYGMIRFLEERGKDYRQAFFINLDNIGKGTVHYMSGEGMFPTHKSSPELLLACQKAALANPGLNVRQGVYNLLSTDALPALKRGFRAISLLSVDEAGLLPNWHWPTDTVENIDEATVQNAVDFISKVLPLLGTEKNNSEVLCQRSCSF